MPDSPPHNLPTLPSSQAATLGEVGEQPRRFGRFNLLRLIAAGGMGEVYEAEELAPGPSDHNRMVVVRRVALKRILPRYLQTPGAVERFGRETQAGKALDHPNIVPVYESGDVSGEHYFTMPYVTGGDLARHIGDNPLTPRQAARVVMQMAQALAYAHQAADKPVIHRDIKPQNIVLQPTPIAAEEVALDDSRLSFIPRLTDFGLARLVAEDSSLSMAQKGEAMGTPGYMPPEQAIGDIDNIGPASDIYSLGAVLYALLAGKPPFPVKQAGPQGQPVQVLAILNQVVNLEPAPIRSIKPDVPEELEDICRKCLRKAPADRYASAIQMAEALDDFLSGRPEVRHTPRAEGWLTQAARRLYQTVVRNPFRSAYLAVTTAGFVLLVALLVLRLGPWSGKLLREAEAHVAAARAKSDPGAAAERFQLACEAYDKLIGELPPNPSTLPAWVARAEAHILRARQLLRLPMHWEDAKEECIIARDQMLQLGEACPGEDEQRRCLADAYQALAEAVVAPDTPQAHQEAVEHYGEALVILQALSDDAPDDAARLQALARCYGYLGDSYLEVGQKKQAWDAYKQAKEKRQGVVRLLAGSPGTALDEARCMRARDFANFARFHQWDSSPGAPKKARDECKARVDYYQKHLAHVRPLPGEFRNERASAHVELASAQLDCLGDRPTARQLDEVFANLDRALAEYRELLQSDRKGYDLRQGKALAEIAYAEGLILQEKKEEAKALLKSALRFYQADDIPKGMPGNLYSRALIHAWLGWLDDSERDRDRALDFLGRAVHRGFHNSARLLRERGLAQLRESPRHAREFAGLLKGIQARFPDRPSK
jgi:serine/threonine protein kinase